MTSGIYTPAEAECAAREKLASWMLAHGFATGHGDTMDDLLKELTWQVEELRLKAMSSLRHDRQRTLLA
jgi:hypothetical protein